MGRHYAGAGRLLRRRIYAVIHAVGWPATPGTRAEIASDKYLAQNIRIIYVKFEFYYMANISYFYFIFIITTVNIHIDSNGFCERAPTWRWTPRRNLAWRRF
jgi:hypothetical protein